MDAVGVIANVIAVVDLSSQLVGYCAQYAQDVKHAKEEKSRLAREMTQLNIAFLHSKSLLESPQGGRLKASHALFQAAVNTKSQLQWLEKQLAPRPSKSKDKLEVWKWPFKSNEVKQVLRELKSCTDSIHTALQIDQTGVLLNIDQKATLGRLPIAEGASYNSRAEEHNSTCLENTRVQLLQEIADWAKDSNSQAIFWLNGMAGTGKSTVSRTISRSFSSSGQLGASFFFKRGEADRGNISRFFSTIAAQLVENSPAAASAIKESLDAHPNACNKAIRDQFDYLFAEPLISVAKKGKQTAPLVIVVDALDECEDDMDIRLIIGLFAEAKNIQLPNLRVFVTSRPELPIRLSFKAIRGSHEGVVLHELPPAVIEHDISVFLTRELDSIRSEHNDSADPEFQLGLDWPGDDIMKSLVQMASPLFIVASTICRFLNDRRCGGIEDKLKEILEYQNTSQSDRLSSTYLPPLNRLIDGLPTKERDRNIHNFHVVVGTLILLESPLPKSALSNLIQMKRQKFDYLFDFLHSVLDIPPGDTPIRLLHLSFRDFLVSTDNQTKTPLWINEKDSHWKLAKDCVRAMETHLKMDICKLEYPGIYRESINSADIAKYMAPELQYACVYWIYHLVKSGYRVCDDDIFYIFISQHLTHWLEALSILGHGSDSVKMVLSLQNTIAEDGASQFSTFTQDALRFVRFNISNIGLYPLQIYSTSLVFSPKNSLVRKLFEHQIPSWILKSPETDLDWNQLEAILDGHERKISSMMFSDDNRLVATASYDGDIRLWDTGTGQCTRVLKGKSRIIHNVSFLNGSEMLASFDNCGLLRIWNVSTGELVQTVKLAITNSSITVIRYSGTSQAIGVLYRQGEGEVAELVFDLAHISNSGNLRKMSLPAGWHKAVDLSFDMELLAVSEENSFRIMNTAGNSDDNVREFAGHVDKIEAVRFFPDSKTVVSGSRSDVRVWNIESGACIREIHGGKALWPQILSCSLNAMVVKGGTTLKAYYASTDTVIHLQIPKDHYPARFSVLSNDLKSLATSNGSSLCLWRIETASHKGKQEESTRNPKQQREGLLLAEDHNVRTLKTDRDATTQIEWYNQHGDPVAKSIDSGSDPCRPFFSQDSRYLALVSDRQNDSKFIQIWHVGDFKNVYKICGLEFDGRFVSFSNKSSCFALWGTLDFRGRDNAGYLHFLHLDGIPDAVFPQRLKTEGPLFFCSSPNGQYLAIGWSELYGDTVLERGYYECAVYSMKDGNIILPFQTRFAEYFGIIFSPNSQLLAVECRNFATIYHVALDDQLNSTKLPRSTAWSYWYRFSPDSKLFVRCFGSPVIHGLDVFRTSDGFCVQRIQWPGRYANPQFGPENDRLYTYRGTLALKGLHEGKRDTEEVKIESESECLVDYGFDDEQHWVLWRGHRLLWLPPQYRPPNLFISGPNLYFGPDLSKKPTRNRLRTNLSTQNHLQLPGSEELENYGLKKLLGSVPRHIHSVFPTDDVKYSYYLSQGLNGESLGSVLSDLVKPH